MEEKIYRGSDRLLIACMSIMAAVVLMLLGLLLYCRLPQPLFFEHHYEFQWNMAEEDVTEFNPWVEFSLKYLTSGSDQRTVSYIEFQDVKENYTIETSENDFGTMDFLYAKDYSYGTSHRPLNIRNVGIKMKAFLSTDLPETLNLSNAVLTMSDGSVFEVNLGEIIIRKNSSIDPVFHWDNRYSGDYGDPDTVANTISFSKPLTFIGLETQDSLKLPDHFLLSINNEPLESCIGRTYEVDYPTTLRCRINPTDKRERYTLYHSSARLLFEDAQGELHRYPFDELFFGFNTIFADADFIDLLQYLTERRTASHE